MHAFFFLFFSSFASAEYVRIHSSCNDIDRDGLYYIKPTKEGKVIPVLCSNGYTMINPAFDNTLSSYPSYLTSYTYGRSSTDWIIPSLDDTSNFKQWWTPSDEYTKFRIAPNCKSCISTEEYGDDTVYYTDSALFCFASSPVAACSADLNEYACNTCDVGTIYADDSWKKCTALRMKSDAVSNYDHDECVTHGLVYRPVLSMTNDACTCYKPQTTAMYPARFDKLPAVTHSSDDPFAYIDPLIHFADNSVPDDDTNCSGNIIYLSNLDFVAGTYRITECGEYILSEDIVFNFNPPSDSDLNDLDFSPNTIDDDELYWFPTKNQDASGVYPGTYSYAGSYALGFFAGITVEADDVIINLNGYSMKMDNAFYLQQRYFTLIECAAKYFLPNQGLLYQLR